MEGIVDGRVADECFVCGLLWPGLVPCPRCAGSMRWLSATVADELDVLARVARGWDSWQASQDIDWLERLLEELHRFAPGSLDALTSVGGDLDTLRDAWSTCMPGQAPDPPADALDPDPMSRDGHDEPA
jgi:hypothetical protein